MNHMAHAPQVSTHSGFTQVPNIVLLDARLSICARLAYAILLQYAWHAEADRAALTRLVEDLNAPEADVRRYLDELETAGLLSKEWRAEKPNYALRLTTETQISF